MNVTINWKEKQLFEGKTLDNQVISISPKSENGDAISPPDLLLMSLGSCTGLFILPSAKAMDVNVENFEVSLEGVKSTTPPKLFDKIIITVKFKGDLTKEEAQKVLEKAHEKCFILHSLNPNIEIENIIQIEK